MLLARALADQVLRVQVAIHLPFVVWMNFGCVCMHNIILSNFCGIILHIQ